MATLRLDKLPDRTPVRYTVSVAPELSRALRDYAEIYRRVHGQKESVEELIPFMLARFVDTDIGFRKARRELLAAGEPTAPATAGTPARPSAPDRPPPKAKGDPK
jgi:hypothetical protein